MIPKPGEIWLADLGLAAKTRPVVIVSRYDPNPPRELVIYIPITTQIRQSPYEVLLHKRKFLKLDSVANVQGTSALPTMRLEKKIGEISSDEMIRIKHAISYALDLDN